MRLLSEPGTKDCKTDGSACSRPSVRGIIVREGLRVMVYSRKSGHSRIPGGISAVIFPKGTVKQ